MIKIFNKFDKKIFTGILVFFIFYFSSIITYIPIFLFNIKEKSLELGVYLYLFSSLVLLLIFYLLYRKDLYKDFKVFKKNIWNYLNTGIIYWIIGVFLMIVSNLLIIYFYRPNGAINEQTVQSMIKSVPWMMLINAGILAPIIEEIVFRKAIGDIFKNKYLFIIISGVSFGLLHVVSSTEHILDLLFVIPYAALGIPFAIMYYKTKNIFTSISFHAFHNFSLVLLSILFK